MRQEILDLIELGPLPSEDAEVSEEQIGIYEDLVHAITPPLTNEEALALTKSFGTDESFGLAWRILHLIETAPGWPIEAALTNQNNSWIQFLQKRITNAESLFASQGEILRANPSCKKQSLKTTHVLSVKDVLMSDFEWIYIPQGQVHLQRQRQDIVVKPFYISKHPITYTQFQTFLDDPNGFSNEQWWGNLPINSKDRSKPIPQRWRFPNHPRENVNWYEAIAFCCWLTSLVDFEIHLPTEAQWQCAAEGSEMNIYPWGNAFDKEKANTAESNLRQTTPVDTYPTGSSKFGVVDMAGNVFEWCLDTYGNPADSLVNSIKRVARGGAYDWNNIAAMCSYAVGFFPHEHLSNCGLRIVGLPK